MPSPTREPVWAALFDLERRIRRIEREGPPANDPLLAAQVGQGLRPRAFAPIPEAAEPPFLAGRRAGMA